MNRLFRIFAGPFDRKRLERLRDFVLESGQGGAEDVSIQKFGDLVRASKTTAFGTQESEVRILSPRPLICGRILGGVPDTISNSRIRESGAGFFASGARNRGKRRGIVRGRGVRSAWPANTLPANTSPACTRRRVSGSPRSRPSRPPVPCRPAPCTRPGRAG
jgi:hypothetical protein